jgi:hypothetical protein
MAPPYGQGKSSLGFLVRMQTYIRRQPSGQRPDGVYALSFLINFSALYALRQHRFFESRSDHFPIVFSLGTLG